MPKKPSPKPAARAPAAGSAALLLKRAQLLIRQGRIAEARRLLTLLARVKGPYQARAKLWLSRLAGLPGRLVKMGRGPVRKKPAKKKGGGGGGGRKLYATRSPEGRLRTGAIKKAKRAQVKKARAPMREKKPARPLHTARAKPPEKKPKPETIRRIPHIDLPDGARKPKDEFTIQVYADMKALRAGESGKDVVIEKEEGVEIYHLEVWVAGTTHFDVVDKGHKPLDLNIEEAETKKVPFKVRVKAKVTQPDRAALFAYFSHEGRPCGQIRVAVPMETGAPPPPAGGGAKPPRPPESSLVISPGAPAADMTIEVTDPNQDTQNLFCRITATKLKPADQPAPDTWKLSSASEALVLGYMSDFTDGKSNPAFGLAGAGRKLFTASPVAFQNAFWKLIDQGTPPETILVMSAEPNIPWELMVPHRVLADGTREKRKALGVEFKVGRWIKDDHLAPPPKVSITDGYVIAPDYVSKPSPLANAAQEVTLLQNSAGGVRIQPATLDEIRDKMGKTGRSLVHFVCHGVDAKQGESQSIYLDGGKETLTSLEITEVPEIEEAFKRRPLVFLNACEVGRPKASLTGIGGFAAAFLELGAAVVIAPLWSVKDTTAFDVAKKFYDGSIKPPPGTARKPFAETMQNIRALAYDPKLREDTYAAYCYYGDPNAEVI